MTFLSIKLPLVLVTAWYLWTIRSRTLRAVTFFLAYSTNFINNWVLSTNHRRIAIMYFCFILISGVSGLVLATAIRVELAYPGTVFLSNNSEKYLTLISLHGVIMVFFMIIPLIFGAFGNFLLPTQLGVRDVAFPRLNSFMFWVTPAGLITLLHTITFDKTYQNISWNSVLQNNPPSNTFSNPTWFKYSKLGVRLNQYSAKPNNYPRLTQRSFWLWNLNSDPLPLQHHLRIRNNLVVCDKSFLKEQPYLSLQLEREFLRSFLDTQTSSSFLEGLGLHKSVLKTKLTNTSSWAPTQLIPGWAFITPYTSKLQFSSIGKVDVVLSVIFVIGLGSVFSSLNYILTYRFLTAPEFKMRRELKSFFVDALLVASRMILAANPALLVAILLLLSDRHLGTSVFDFSGGGDTILFQHLFWFFGHPEVYIIILPCFGFINSLLPHYLKKRLSGRLSLLYSMYTIGVMSFVVWGHHMYMVGLSNGVRSLYSTMTVMISIPASTKVIHWCVTFLNAAFITDTGFLFLLAFIYFFVFGGMSGMFVAHAGFDILFHDTFYVIGHFHVMLSGAAMSACFGAFYFYFPTIFGVHYNKFFAKLHFIFYVSGQTINLTPMFWLGYAGMPRRIMDYPSVFGGWHSVSSSGHLLTVFSVIFFITMILLSLYEGRTSSDTSFGVSRFSTRFSFFIFQVNKLTNTTAELRVKPFATELTPHWKISTLVVLC